MEDNSPETRQVLPEAMKASMWKPGAPSPNPSGRPKGSKNRSTVLRELYDLNITGHAITGGHEEMTVEKAVMTGLVRKAIEGDVAAIREAQDSLYGKSADNINIESPQGTMSPSVSRVADLLQSIRGKPDGKD